MNDYKLQISIIDQSSLPGRSCQLARCVHDWEEAISDQPQRDWEQGGEGRALQIPQIWQRPPDEFRRQQGQECQVRDQGRRCQRHAAGA